MTPNRHSATLAYQSSVAYTYNEEQADARHTHATSLLKHAQRAALRERAGDSDEAVNRRIEAPNARRCGGVQPPNELTAMPDCHH